MNEQANLIHTLEKQVAQLKKKQVVWKSAKQKPEYNLGVLVFIPEEDSHITSGMWDISNKWVLLDEYRVPTCEVTHWAYMPEPPITNLPSKNLLSHSQSKLK